MVAWVINRLRAAGLLTIRNWYRLRIPMMSAGHSD
jgi:hypothetical protein